MASRICAQFGLYGEEDGTPKMATDSRRLTADIGFTLSLDSPANTFTGESSRKTKA